MNRSDFAHSLYLTAVIIFCFLWSSTPFLSQYNLQLTGAITFVYFVIKMVSAKHSSSPAPSLSSTLILTTITLLLVFSTGSATSPLFFLLDFLLFALALLFQPIHAGVTATLLIGIFLWQNQSQLTPGILISLLSLAFMTPLAIIFGRNYLSSLAQKGRIHILTETLREEEADSLLWVSTSAKPSLSTIINNISDLVMYFNSKGTSHIFVPSSLIDKLRLIQKDLITLYTSTTTFEQSIQESSDKVEE